MTHLVVERAGTLEVLHTTVKKAVMAMENSLSELWPDAFPDFSHRYEDAQSILRYGVFKRSKMPVISDTDMQTLKTVLATGVRSYQVMYNPRKLVPLQSQIYLSKIIMYLKRHGVEGAQRSFGEEPILVSGDRHIIDGHHRWMDAFLLGKDLAVYEFGLSAEALLLMAIGLSDKEGHQRNR